MTYTKEQQEEGAELMRTLVEKAWDSAAFKEQLINNPIETIETVTGKKTNENFKFVVDDQSDDSIVFINIPRKVELNSLELTDEQLEMVSGGEIVLGLAIGAAFLTGMGVGVAIYVAVN